MPTKTTVVDIVCGNTLRSPPENQHAICHKKRAFREHQFWESMMTWSPLLYKIQILQRQADHNKAERETFCEDINQRSENDLAYSIWFSLATSLNFTWVGTSTSKICASGLKLNPMNLPIALLAKRKWLCGMPSGHTSLRTGNRATLDTDR